MKNLPYEWLVGIRYTLAGKRGNRFISFISGVSIAVTALGVLALIVVMSVWNGFQTEVRDRMLSVLSHIEVFDRTGALPDWQATAREAFQHTEVKAAAPYVLGQAMVTRDSAVRGVTLRGVLPQEEIKVSDVVTTLHQGKFENLKSGELNIVLGRELAKGLQATVGDRINLVTPQRLPGASSLTPQLRQFTVAGIFEAGHFGYDSTLAFIHMDDAMTLFNRAAPSGVRLKINDMQRAPQVARDLSQSLSGDMLIRDWGRQNRTWFAAVQSQKSMMFLILLLIVAVAAFNLVSTLVMTVTDKRADIAILRTLGASPGAIMKIFVIQGTLVGSLGIAIGVALGLGMAFNAGAIVTFIEGLFGVKFLASDVYLISALPSEVRWSDIWTIVGVTYILSFLATLYPSWRAARVRPAEALRYE